MKNFITPTVYTDHIIDYVLLLFDTFGKIPPKINKLL